jgi:hypothetical protein
MVEVHFIICVSLRMCKCIMNISTIYGVLLTHRRLKSFLYLINNGADCNIKDNEGKSIFTSHVNINRNEF